MDHFDAWFADKDQRNVQACLNFPKIIAAVAKNCVQNLLLTKTTENQKIKTLRLFFKYF